eukprot:m.354780 g.354780  ORF g.354780 m.354780 type:complete len:437 (+) comp17102_c0_seq1:2745-4055(+)
MSREETRGLLPSEGAMSSSSKAESAHNRVDKQRLLGAGDGSDSSQVESTSTLLLNDDYHRSPDQSPKYSRRDWIAYFLLGLTNNYGYVIMLSGAHDMLQRTAPNLGTGVVLLADIVPTFVVKTTAPLYLQRFSYSLRVLLTIATALASFLLVALSNTTAQSLIGVVFASLSAGLGEVTFLSMSSHHHKSTISGWSSGTGAAGAVGALSYLGLTSITTPEVTLFVMTVIPVIMFVSYFYLLTKRPAGDAVTSSPRETYTFAQKVTMTKTLVVPYMIPLFLVYVSEYMINQGLYENIVYANIFISSDVQYRVYQTLYQIGVFVSRSSHGCVQIKRIYIPAILQMINFVLLYLLTYYQVIHSIWPIFVWILYEGVLGGLVYVNAFALISASSKPEQREFRMGVASIADTFGIALAGGLSIVINNSLKSHKPIPNPRKYT